MCNYSEICSPAAIAAAVLDNLDKAVAGSNKFIQMEILKLA